MQVREEAREAPPGGACGESLSENSQGGAVHANSMETNSE